MAYITKEQLAAEVEYLKTLRFELEQKIKEQEETHAKEILEIQKAFEEKRFQDWKQQNGVYVEKLFEEFVNKHLSISLNCDYGGSVETTLYYDSDVISSDSDSVIVNHNSLEG